MPRSPLNLAALACGCAFFAAAHTLVCAPVQAQQEQPVESQTQHVQPGQLAQSTLPKPTKLVTRSPKSVPAIEAASLSDAAAKIALALADFKAQRVAVLDFAIPQEPEWNRAGQKLAADFRADLGVAAPNVEQLSREDVAKYMKRFDLAQEDLPIPGVAAYMMERSIVNAWVAAEIKRNGDSAIVLAFTAHVVDRHGASINVDLPMTVTPALAALVDPPAPAPMHGLSVVNTVGHTGPACEYCPQTEYTAEAVKAQLQGTVFLLVTIEPSGSAGEIHVVRGLPFGLSQAAADSIRNWRFKPAFGPDGKPVEVAQTVEVTFRLF